MYEGGRGGDPAGDHPCRAPFVRGLLSNNPEETPMTRWMDTVRRTMTALLVTMTAWLTLPGLMLAQEPAQHAGGEANLVLPDLGTVSFLGGTSGRTLLMFGLLVAGLGLIFRVGHLQPAPEPAGS